MSELPLLSALEVFQFSLFVLDEADDDASAIIEISVT